MPPFVAIGLTALLDLLYPETCAICGAGRDGRAWSQPGPPVPGLRSWDAPHLCAGCAHGLGPSRTGRIVLDGERTVPVVAAAPADADLVSLVGRFKYKGVRGLAWPLAAAMKSAAERALAVHGPVAAVVPVPLHRLRRRERGYNQAAVLAHLVGRALDLDVRDDLIRRRRATPRQASLTARGTDRARNVASAFVARPPACGEPTGLMLVDDLLTTGATWASAARTLERVGWRVRCGLALGLAARLASGEGETGPPTRLDTGLREA